METADSYITRRDAKKECVPHLIAMQTLPEYRISGLQFHLLGEQEILRRSVAEIKETAIYNKNVPKEHGVSDRRMGTADRRIKCATCGLKIKDCSGHEGHIQFPSPVVVYHPFFLLMTLKLLRSVCFFCSRLLVADMEHATRSDDVKLQKKMQRIWARYVGQERFQAVTKLAQNRKHCRHCGGQAPVYAKEVKNYMFGIRTTWDEQRFLILDMEPEQVEHLVCIRSMNKSLKAAFVDLKKQVSLDKKTGAVSLLVDEETEALYVQLQEEDLSAVQIEALHHLAITYPLKTLLKVWADLQKELEPFVSYTLPEDLDDMEELEDRVVLPWTPETVRPHLQTLLESRRHERALCMRTFTSVEAYNIVTNITDEDTVLLGLDPEYGHPRNWFIAVMNVTPPQVRPTVTVSEGSRSRGQNDLTKQSLDILKSSNALAKELKQQPDAFQQPVLPKGVRVELMMLQYRIVTYMNNEQRGLKVATSRNGAPLKSLQHRIAGKQGRIRGNLMGKRVDFSARTVITPDPNLEVDELGVPYAMALTLTYPETVTPYNMKAMKQCVSVGPNQLGGAESVIVGSRVMKLQLFNEEQRNQIQLECGMKVERYMKDDDVVLFNRQPSLHKLSVMAHRVKVMHGKTFRLNLSVTSPYNADFDGTCVCFMILLLLLFLTCVSSDWR